MEEVPDVLEDKVAGLLHLEGEGVAVEPGSDKEEDLVEEKEEREVVSNNHPALQTFNFEVHFSDAFEFYYFLVMSAFSLTRDKAIMMFLKH